jgi:hypothetical protein
MHISIEQTLPKASAEIVISELNCQFEVVACRRHDVYISLSHTQHLSAALIVAATALHQQRFPEGMYFVHGGENVASERVVFLPTNQ